MAGLTGLLVLLGALAAAAPRYYEKHAGAPLLNVAGTETPANDEAWLDALSSPNPRDPREAGRSLVRVQGKN